ncbi:hypothetical protein ES705_15981 [subsurface metagenome]
MRIAIALIGWQFILLAHLEKIPDIKLPTLDEIRAMKKAAYRRFREAIKRQRQPVK